MKIPFGRWMVAGALGLWTVAAWSQSGVPGVEVEAPRLQGAVFQDETYFPIGVWLQNPKNAGRFKAAGINLFVGLWRGPNAEQLASLKKAGMPVICGQNAFALTNRDSAIIAGWMHSDEPDNAQSRGQGKGYGPPVLPEKIQRDYEKIRATDPTRPVFLNLGQGVAWDNYIGRGVRRNHPEDYPEYIKGADIVSFDIYPVVHDHPDIEGKLEYVARGVKRLVEWSGGEKTVWNCIECTHISNPARKATPEQIRAEVWMALIHGSRGLVYFVHQFEPTFKEAALLEDAETLEAVTRINAQVAELARVLNRPSASAEVVVTTGENDFPIATMVKEFEGKTYLFTVGMENKGGKASFKSSALPRSGMVEVLGESRNIPLAHGSFADEFKPYEVHLYRVGRSEP
jgi:hypothetical protein